MPPRLVRLADLAPRPWPNGLGLTRDIASGPGWEIGVAELGADAAFSHFPETDRLFTLIAGPGAALELEGRGTLPCRPFVPVAFPGDVPTHYRALGGPARAFNVFARRAALAAAVTVTALAPAHRVAAPECLALHCAEGALMLGETCLEAGDTVLNPGAAAMEALSPAVVLMMRLATV